MPVVGVGWMGQLPARSLARTRARVPRAGLRQRPDRLRRVSSDGVPEVPEKFS
jgi:hypothetical protein